MSERNEEERKNLSDTKSNPRCSDRELSNVSDGRGIRDKNSRTTLNLSAQDEAEPKLLWENQTRTEDTRCAIRTTLTIGSHDRELEVRFRMMETDAFQLRLAKSSGVPSGNPRPATGRGRARSIPNPLPLPV